MSGGQAQSARAGTLGWGSTLSRSVWQWQLILAVSVVGVAAAAALLDPGLFLELRFTLAVITIVLLTCVALVVQWHRFDRRFILLLPAFDIVAIGFLSAGADARMSFLWAFPVVWIATYYSVSWLSTAIGAITTMLLIDAMADGLNAIAALQLVIVVIVLGFMGITVHLGTSRTRALGRLLRRQYGQLGRSLDRVALQERRATEFFDSLDVGLARIDRRGALRTANSVFRRLYGIADVGSPHPTGAVEYDDYRGAPVPPSETLIARAARGDAFDDHRVWLFDTHGTWHALDATTRPLGDSGILASTNLLTVRDVTASVEADADRRGLTRVVSHELRNPLTAILGHTDLMLERDDLDDDLREQLAVVESASERMLDMVDTLLVTESAAARTVEPIDLGAIVRASVDAHRAAARAAQIDLDDEYEDDTVVVGDAFRLRQVADNLIGNAVKYTPRGGRVSVAARSTSEAVVLTVDDTGIGMSGDDLARAFEPYFRSDRARDSGIPGTGLGMGISRGIVQEHDGALDLTSVVGTGTWATVTLPRHRPEGSAA